MLAALALAGCGASDDDRPATPDGPLATSPATVETRTEPAPAPAPPPANGPVRRMGGTVLRRVQLRATPGGRVVRALGTKTTLGGKQILAIVAHRDGWYGVLHESLPNGKAGWIPTDAVELVREPWEIVVDRSEHRLHLYRGGKEVDRFPVATGRPGSPTPTGRFAVTDRLIPAKGSPYGCCILALSGRQTNLPPGWTGGDRLALHGVASDTVGGAYSSGCVRIRERDLRRLMRDIPAGTRVTVRA